MGRAKECTEFWWGNLYENDHMEDQGHGRITRRYIWSRLSGWNWPRIPGSV